MALIACVELAYCSVLLSAAISLISPKVVINSNSKPALDLMIPPVGSYYADDPRLIMHNEITNFIKHNFY
jgi:hypothetical protein